MDCIFCKIAHKTIPADTVAENEAAIAFLDIHPVTKGHTLVIPRQHFATMAETPDDVLAQLIAFSKQLMVRLRSALGADYVALSVVGVDVPHFHVHLIPRKINDGLASFWPTTEYAPGEAAEVAARIRQSI